MQCSLSIQRSPVGRLQYLEHTFSTTVPENSGNLFHLGSQRLKHSSIYIVKLKRKLEWSHGPKDTEGLKNLQNVLPHVLFHTVVSPALVQKCQQKCSIKASKGTKT